MPIALIWGYLLTAQMPGMPPIMDPNFGPHDGEKCLKIAADFKAEFPAYEVNCDPTWKPDSAPKHHHLRRWK